VTESLEKDIYVRGTSTHEVGSDEGRGGGASDGGKGVDHGTLLLDSRGKSRVEGRPEHEEEHCSDHGEDVRVVGGCVVLQKNEKN